MADYYGAVNVGGGWGPPPLNAGLLMYYDQQAQQGVGRLARMAGGAIGGGLAASKPTEAELANAVASGQAPPGRNWARGMKGALIGAAEEADPEVKRRNQEYLALQKYAESAHGLPKEQTTPMGLDELRGIVRAYEYNTLQRERRDAMDISRDRNTLQREHQAAVNKYYNDQMRLRQQAADLDADRFRADQDWQSAYGQAFQAYGDERRAIAQANAVAPGGMPSGVASDLLGQSRVAANAKLTPQSQANMEYVGKLSAEAEKRLQDALADPRLKADANLIRQLRTNRDFWEGERKTLMGSGVAKEITRDAAAEFFRQAGGDKDKARELARQAGYTWIFMPDIFDEIAAGPAQAGGDIFDQISRGDRQRQSAAMAAERLALQAQPQATMLGEFPTAMAEVGGDVARGVSQMPVGMLRFAGAAADAIRRHVPTGPELAVGGDRSALTSAGDWIEGQVNRLPGGDPGALSTQFNRGIGQMGSMLVGGGATKLLGGTPAAAASVGASLGFGAEFDDAFGRARERGDDPDTALAKSLGYASVATLIENIGGAGRVLRRLMPNAKRAAETLSSWGVSREIAQNFLAGYAEEAAQRVAQNVIVAPDEPMLAGAHEEGRVGALVQGLVGIPGVGVRTSGKGQETATDSRPADEGGRAPGQPTITGRPAPPESAAVPVGTRFLTFRDQDGRDIQVEVPPGADADRYKEAAFLHHPDAELVGEQVIGGESAAGKPTAATVAGSQTGDIFDQVAAQNQSSSKDAVANRPADADAGPGMDPVTIRLPSPPVEDQDAIRDELASLQEDEVDLTVPESGANVPAAGAETITGRDAGKAAEMPAERQRELSPTPAKPSKLRRQSDRPPDIIDEFEGRVGGKIDPKLIREADPNFKPVGAARKLFRKGGIAADVALNAMTYGEDMGYGLTKDMGLDAFGAALNSAAESRKGWSRQQAKQSQQQDLEGKQYAAFESKVLQGQRPKREAGKVEQVPVGDLLEGDTFKVQNVTFEVQNVEYDEDGNAVSLTLKDGPKFGVQVVNGGEVIHIDTGSLQNQTSQSKPSSADASDSPFSLADRRPPVRPISEQARPADDSRIVAWARQRIGRLAQRMRPARQSRGLSASQLDELERAFGVRIVMVEGTDGHSLPFRGVVPDRGQRIIMIDAASDKPVATVAGHEILHTIRSADPDLYADLVEQLAPMMAGLPEYQARLDRLRQDAGLAPATRDQAVEELLADFLGDNIADPEFWQRLRGRDAGVFERVALLVRQWINRLIGRRQSGNDFGSQAHFADLAKAREVLADMLHRYGGQDRTAVDRSGSAQFWLSDEASKLRSQIDATRPVEISGTEAPAAGGIKVIVEWARKNVADRAIHPVLGEVATDARAVKQSLSHGMTRAKVAAVAVLPTLVERGVIASREPMQGGDAVVLVAPMTIAGHPHRAFMLLKRDANTKRLYVHEVVGMEKLLTLSRPGLASQHTGAAGAIRRVAQALYGVKDDAPQPEGPAFSLAGTPISPQADEQLAIVEAQSQNVNERAPVGPRPMPLPMRSAIRDAIATQSSKIVYYGSDALLRAKQTLDLRTAYQSAAVKRQSDGLVRKLFDDARDAQTGWKLPRWMKVGAWASRTREFKRRVLHLASRLNATGRNPDGSFRFDDFAARAGMMSTKAFKAGKHQVGDTIVHQDPQTGLSEELAIGPLVTTPDGRAGYQLTRRLSAKLQGEIYRAAADAYPEQIWLLDMFIDPALAGMRQTVNGVEVPVFNRFAQAAMMAANDPNFTPLSGYTPDVLVSRGLMGAIRGALSFSGGTRSPGRKYKFGTSRESGHVRDLLSGFNVRTVQMLQENARREWRQEILKAATPIPKAGVPQGWVKLDTGMEDLWQAVKRLRRWTSPVDPQTGDPIFPETQSRLTDDGGPQYQAFFGEAARLRGRQLMIPERLQDVLIKQYVEQRMHGALYRLGAWGIRNSTQLLLAHPYTYVGSVITNVLFEMEAGTKYALRGLLSGNMEDIRTARNIFGGMMLNRFMAFRQVFGLGGQFADTVQEVLPDQVFADSTSLSDVKVQWGTSVLDYLRSGEIGAAALQLMQYGNIDLRSKQRIAYAFLKAKAVTGAKRAGLTGQAQRQAVERYMANPPPEDRRAAVEAANFELLNYADSPAWITAMAGSDYGKAVVPFPRFGYHYLTKQAKRIAGLKLFLGKVPKGQRANALADLLTVGIFGLGGGGLIADALLKAMGGDDDEDVRRRIGSSSVWKANADGSVEQVPIDREFVLSNRINLSRILRMMGLDGDREDEFWLRVRQYPMVAMGGVIAMAYEDAMKHGAKAGAKTMATGVSDLVGDFFSVGAAIKIPSKLYAEWQGLGKTQRVPSVADPYATQVPLAFYVTEQLLDTFLPGTRQADELIAIVDPVRRRRTATKSLDYEPGIAEAVRLSHWTGLLDRLARGGASTMPPAGPVDRRTKTVDHSVITPWETYSKLLGINLRSVNRQQYEEALRP